MSVEERLTKIEYQLTIIQGKLATLEILDKRTVIWIVTVGISVIAAVLGVKVAVPTPP